MVNTNAMKMFDLFQHADLILEDLEGQKAERGKWIKDKLAPHFKGIPGYPTPDDLDKLIDKIGQVDPSRNGMYMPWIARMAIGKPSENRAEDLDRVGQDLQHFEQFKRQIENKDINSYKGFQQLYDVIAPFITPKALSKDEKEKAKQRAALEKVKNDIITVYSGPEGWIRIPTTRDAAIYLGQNTRWCTSARGNNMFDSYSKSDNLFVVHDKAQAKVYGDFVRDPENKNQKPPANGMYQLHIDSGQFASDDDSNKGMNAVPEWARKPIFDYYKANNPKLTRKQIITLSGFGGENLAAGTKHERVLNLMKKYNVL